MPRTNWKKFHPNSLQDAMEGCTKFALEKHNRGIDRIAGLMGLASKYTLYKWLGNGRMPAVENAHCIRPEQSHDHGPVPPQ